ncbi:hypothetical protein O6H91_03G077200 [Diphasiastrum complanatum]|uniref:Uncharacterized protein n=1 Tax=Diphasiastrum complanatum TaxID=34168 RepID=A0ACC2E887_DIPCM|nr:hypothetical protein O6H91_03G077200 [Diphasiastrum complanatum]
MRYLPEGKCVTYTVFQAVLILYKMRTLISCIPERYLYQDVFACVILLAELGVKAKAWSKNLQTIAHLLSIKGFLSINEATSFSLISTSNDGLMYRQYLDCDQCMKLSFVNTQASNCVI